MIRLLSIAELKEARGNVNSSFETTLKKRVGAASYLVLGYCGFAAWRG